MNDNYVTEGISNSPMYTGVMVAWYGSTLSRFENIDVLCRFLYYLEESFPRIISPLLLQ
jgi:hypothetical protein